MNSEIQFKIVRGKGSYGSNALVKSVGDVLNLNTEAETCQEIRILHCANLTSMEGIEVCRHLVRLNLSSNRLESIEPVRFLVNLQQLDLKANRIRSLRGLGKLQKLIKLDVSHNIVDSLEGLGSSNASIQSIVLFQNNLKHLQELNIFKQFNKLSEISFERNNKSNPFCENRQEYYNVLRSVVSNSRMTLQKIDDMSKQQVQQWVEKKSARQEKSVDYSASNLGNEESAFFENKKIVTATNALHHNSNAFQHNNNTFQHSSNPNLTSQKVLFLTQRQYDLQRLVDIKQEAIQQLKSKNNHLQMTNANFYKDSLKKQVEYERICGQISEMGKSVDQKDAKVNELHRRIEEMLKINAASNASGENKTAELEKVRRECNDFKIENAELRAVNKDQEGRLRELQSKALTNIEDKSSRIEQLRRKNEDLMRQNYEFQKLQDEYKDRIRQLTQLLKEWEFKYEQKIKEMEYYHNSERGDLIKQFQSKEEGLTKNHEETVKHLYSEFEDKIKALEDDYSEALQTSLQKFAILKKSYDDKSSSEAELKMVFKTVLAKNTQQEQTINQCQEVILSSRKKINEKIQQNEGLLRELSEFRGKAQIEVKQMQSELSKAMFQRSRLEKENKDLKLSNEYLQSSFDKLSFKEKEMQQMEQKIQNLESALQVKNVMLDNKNETIDSLRIELQNAQGEVEGKMDSAQYEKLNTKYRKNKEKIRQIEDRMLQLVNENKELSEKVQIYGNMEQEFTELRDIMNKQEAELTDKKENVVELIDIVEKLKGSLKNYQEEVASAKIEKNKLLNSLEDKQNRWIKTMRQKQSQFKQKEGKMQQEMGKLKQVVRHLNQISNLTKGLTF